MDTIEDVKLAISKYTSSEISLLHRKEKGIFTACVTYPEEYKVSILNVGFQQVIKEIHASQKWTAYRSFLLDDVDYETTKSVPLMAWEDFTLVKDTNIWFFSIACEDNCLNVINMIKQSQVPLYSKDRGLNHPLIIGGGPLVNYNPEPLADFFDLFVLGESEGAISPILDIYEFHNGNKLELLKRMDLLPFVYIPGFYEQMAIGSELFLEPKLSGAKTLILCNKVADYEKLDTNSIYVSNLNIKKKKMMSMEVVRGCHYGCRFCHLGNTHGYARYKPFSQIDALIQMNQNICDEVKLIFPSDLSHDIIHGLLENADKYKTPVNVGSLRASSLTKEILELLYRLGKRDISIAPETSERGRLYINKKMNDELFYKVIHDAIEIGMEEICLFLIIGFPSETYQDIQDIFAFIDKILCIMEHNKRQVTLCLDINPFFAKPHTPFQWAQSPNWEYTLEIKTKFMQQYKNNKNVVIESIIGSLEHFRQNIICRASRNITPVINRVADALWEGKTESIKLWKDSMDEFGYDLDESLVCHDIDDKFIWDIFNFGIDKFELKNEYIKSTRNY